MSPVLAGYLAGLATIPALALAALAGWLAVRRSTIERVWCRACPDLPDGRPAYVVHPSASRLPAWVWTWSWRAHTATTRHRTAYAAHQRVAVAAAAVRAAASDAALLDRYAAT